jgi:hypothetical protein
MNAKKSSWKCIDLGALIDFAFAVFGLRLHGAPSDSSLSLSLLPSLSLPLLLRYAYGGAKIAHTSRLFASCRYSSEDKRYVVEVRTQRYAHREGEGGIDPSELLSIQAPLLDGIQTSIHTRDTRLPYIASLI